MTRHKIALRIVLLALAVRRRLTTGSELLGVFLIAYGIGELFGWAWFSVVLGVYLVVVSVLNGPDDDGRQE